MVASSQVGHWVLHTYLMTNNPTKTRLGYFINGTPRKACLWFCCSLCPRHKQVEKFKTFKPRSGIVISSPINKASVLCEVLARLSGLSSLIWLASEQKSWLFDMACARVRVFAPLVVQVE